MTYLFERFPFEDGARLTGVWSWPWPADPGAADLQSLASFIDLGEGQDPALEADFLSSHLPWAFGGLHGVGPDGRPWLVIVQLAPESASTVIEGTQPWWPMHHALERALAHNPAAEPGADDLLDRLDLTEVYADAGVGPELVAEWPVTDLVMGLLAECTGVSLPRLVAGRLTGCSLPDLEHECEHDPFRDAFGAWAAGLLVQEADEAEGEADDDFADDEDDDDVDVDDTADDDDSDDAPDPRWGRKRPPRVPRRRSRKRVRGWSAKRLRRTAVKDGWSPKRARKASRKDWSGSSPAPACRSAASASSSASSG